SVPDLRLAPSRFSRSGFQYRSNASQTGFQYWAVDSITTSSTSCSSSHAASDRSWSGLLPNIRRSNSYAPSISTSDTTTASIFLSDPSALHFEVGLTQPRRVENAPLATSAATASISGANGLSTDNMGDFARTVSCALRASVPVCNGASRSIPWQAHSSSIAIV